MKINRLFEIVYILLNKKTVTAMELSQHFEVSLRTIYRDIDVLSTAGIPIYTVKGKGGGISLMEDFVFDKSVLSEGEQNEILMGLLSLNAVKFPDIEPVLNKLSTLFNKQVMDWIDVDFSHWSSDDTERKKFNTLKTAILNSTMITFDYFSSYGEKTQRVVEPVKLLFKGQGWYLYGFCRGKNAFRIFKIIRIKNLRQLKEFFQRKAPKDIWRDFTYDNHNLIRLVLKIDEKMAFRVYDEFKQEDIIKNSDGSFTVTTTFPEGEWIYSYVLSFGSGAEVLEPEQVRNVIKRKVQETFKKYF